MNSSLIPQSIFSSIEKVLRYLMPGLLIVFLFKTSFSPDKLYSLRTNITERELYLLSPVFGFVIYTVYRVLFWFADTCCRKYRNISLANSLRGQATLKETYPELAEILYYRAAIIHFGLVLSELVLIFSFLAEKGSAISLCWPYLPVSAGIFFVICTFFYIRFKLADLELVQEVNKNDNANDRLQPIADKACPG